jgi:hypothetical protein
MLGRRKIASVFQETDFRVIPGVRTKKNLQRGVIPFTLLHPRNLLPFFSPSLFRLLQHVSMSY